jgi:hypothetical protein
MKQWRGTYDSVCTAASSFADSNVICRWKCILFYQPVFQEIFEFMEWTVIKKKLVMLFKDYAFKLACNVMNGTELFVSL